MGIIEWLNTNSGAIIAIATVVLVGIISYYKNKSLTMPKHKGRYPDPAPKCLMNSLTCCERLLTSLHSRGIQHDSDFPNT